MIDGPGVDKLTLNSLATAGFEALWFYTSAAGDQTLQIRDLTFQQAPTATLRLIRAVDIGRVTIADAELIGNGNPIAASSGGAVFMLAGASASISLHNTSFVDNKTSAQSGRGGAVYSNDAINVDGGWFSGNETMAGDGGAIYSDGTGALTIANSVFSGNAAGAFAGATSANLLNVTMTGNTGSAACTTPAITRISP